MVYTAQAWTQEHLAGLGAGNPDVMQRLANLEAAVARADVYFNPYSYGGGALDPTGNVSAWAGFQAAANACIAAGGGTVYRPPGTWLLDQTLQFINGTAVKFDGPGVLMNAVANGPMVRFRNCLYPEAVEGAGPMYGNWVSNAVGIEVDGCLYGKFAIRGDMWPNGMNVICSPSATQNSANNDLSLDIANGVNGMMFQGNVGGTLFASNNRISRVTWGGAGSGNPIGINFARYADSNKFRWASISLNTASSIAVLYNSDTPGSDKQVYENDFDWLTVQSSVAGATDIKANVTTGTAARTSFIRLRRAGSFLTTASLAAGSDIQFINTNDGTNGYIGKDWPSGTGAPTIAGKTGDGYRRVDTPSTANQRLYVCTTGGAAGTAVWTGIA